MHSHRALYDDENFAENDAKKFLGDTLAPRDNVPKNLREEIVNYMKDIFGRFYEEGKNSTEWNLPIKNWMKEYARKLV